MRSRPKTWLLSALLGIICSAEANPEADRAKPAAGTLSLRPPSGLVVDAYPGFGHWAELRSMESQLLWKQENPAAEFVPTILEGTLASDILRFRLPPLPKSAGRFGPRTVWPDEAPSYRFALIDPRDRDRPKRTFDVGPVRAQPGWPRAVVGEPRVVDCGDSQAQVAWRFERKPADSTAELMPASGCVASFRPDVRGQYFIEETVSRKKIFVVAGERPSDGDCARSTCHPTLVAEMRQTVHAGTCASCHATGFFYTTNDASACAPCHVATWRNVAERHHLPIDWPEPELEAPACARCHSAEGHRAWLLTGRASLRYPMPMRRDISRGAAHACVSCHAPHDGAPRGTCGDCHLTDEAKAADVEDCSRCHDAHTLLATPGTGPCTRGLIPASHALGNGD